MPRRDPARARAALAAFAPALGIVNVTLDATGDGLVVETCSETTEIASVDVPVSRVVSPMATRKGPPCGCGAHALGEGWPAGDGCNRSGCVAPGRVVTTEAACVHVPFEPVAFPRGSAVPPEKLGAIADQLVAILAGRPDLRVTLRGHDRTAKGDGPLAWQRAVVVRDALIARGAPASRLVIAAGVTDDEARAAKGADLADLTTFEAHVP